MTGERIEVRDREDFVLFLKKADEALRSMRENLEHGRFNSAGLEAVQVVISSGDALTTFHLGLRSTSSSHTAVLGFLRKIPKEGMPQLLRQVADVLDLKNAVQYEPGMISEADARRISTQAERVYSRSVELTSGVGDRVWAEGTGLRRLG